MPHGLNVASAVWTSIAGKPAMNITNNSIRLPLPPERPPQPPPPNLDANDPASLAAAPQSAATPLSASYFQALGSLATLLDMAGPINGTSHDLVGNPLMALSLTAPPAGTQSGQGVVYAPDADVVTQPNPEDFARQIIDKLGSGGALSLDEAQQALVTPNPGHQTNEAATVARLFGREDTNHDGKLSQSELSKLMSYYRDNVTPTTTPKLPATWA
jgi:hypothetical protein